MRAVVMIRLTYEAEHLNAKDLQKSWLEGLQVPTYEGVVEVEVHAKILGVRDGKLRTSTRQVESQASGDSRKETEIS